MNDAIKFSIQRVGMSGADVVVYAKPEALCLQA
jgi:hypothetical protein